MNTREHCHGRGNSNCRGPKKEGVSGKDERRVQLKLLSP